MKVSSGQISLTVLDQVLVADNAAFDGFLPEKMTPLLVASQDKFKFSHIIAGASALSRGLLPRVAAKLDVSPISDIIGVKDENTFDTTPSVRKRAEHVMIFNENRLCISAFWWKRGVSVCVLCYLVKGQYSSLHLGP